VTYWGANLVEPKKNRLDEMTYEEVGEAIRNGKDTIVMPVGAIEQHGPHGALGVDAYCAVKVGEKVAEKLGAILAPLMPYGSSGGQMMFPGTVSLSSETLLGFTKDACRSLLKHGFKKIVFVNGNEPNYYPMLIAIREVREETGAIITISNWYSALADVWKTLDGVKGTEKEGWKWSYFMAHGGLLETSVAMTYKEKVFRMDRITTFPSDRREAFSNAIVTMPVSINESTKLGSYGDPKGAKAVDGEVWAEVAATRIVENLRRLFDAAQKKP